LPFFIALQTFDRLLGQGVLLSDGP